MMYYKCGHFGILNIGRMENEPLRLLDGGIERRYRESYDYFNDDRPDYSGYLIQYTLDGKGRYCRGEKEWELEKGMAFLVSFPEKSRYCLPQEQEEGWDFWYLHFDGAAAALFADRIREISGGVFYLDPGNEAVQMVLRMYERLTGGGRLGKYEGGEFLYRFLCAVLREVEEPLPRPDSLAAMGMRMMDAEYGVLGGVEEVAGRLGITQAYFSRIFKREMGMKPMEYLTRQRLQAAVNDLLNTKDTLDAIAGRNGFSNGNYFCKVFRRYMEMSPMEYRKSRRC